MTRKIINAILLSFLITCSNYILAGTQGLLIPNFNGFYAGGSVGGTITSAHESIVFNGMETFPEFVLGGTDVLNDLFTELDLKIKQSAVIGQLYAGYGRTWQMFYLGGEVFGNFSHYKMKTFLHALDILNFATELGPDIGLVANTQNHNYYRSNITISPLQWGVDLRPGFLATPDLLLYGRVGVARAKLSLNTNVLSVTPYGYQIENLALAEQFVTSTTLGLKSSKHVAALRLGAGLEYSMNPNWSIRMDYIYVYYGKLSVAGNVTQVIPSDPPVFPGGPGLFGPGLTQLMHSTSVKTIQTNTVMFGISYYPQIF